MTSNRLRSVSRSSACLLAAAALWIGAAPARAGVFGDPSSFEQVRRHLGAHREDVALVAYTVRPDGTPDPADPVLMHNADTPMPLASTIKVVLLAAYARDVVATRLDPLAEVPVGDWERYYLPGTDGGAHPDALAELGIPADGEGFALDPTTAVTIDRLVWAMIRHSDNAAADWLRVRLGDAAVAATIADAGLTGQDQPPSMLGVVLAWSNHERPSISAARIEQYVREPGSFAAEVRRLEAAYLDPAWRDAELTWRRTAPDAMTIWDLRPAVDRLAPRGTAADYARLMAGAVTGTCISEEVSAVMRVYLQWLMEFPGMDQVFETAGVKGGSLDGAVLTEAGYYVPLAGDFAGRPRVCVLFMRRMPVLAYFAMTRSGSHQMLEMGVVLDRAFGEKVRRTLAPAR